MRNLRGTYVHRGDAIRRRNRVRRLAFLATSVVVTAGVITAHRASSANAEPTLVANSASVFSAGGSRELRTALAAAQGELSLVKAQIERADKVIQYSTEYSIPAGLAGKVFDASMREGVDPELAFRLVRLESEFNPHAVSKTGAIGLTQMMPSTAKMFDKNITRDKLFVADVNLKLGMHYLRSLLDMYSGNVRLALLAYNRGEDAVWRDVRAGVNPGNGYDRMVIGDYKGKGIIQ
jgi:soluble lytic murein transglycosylase-like protein